MLGNICLKARAHRERSQRNAKHRNDILRMAPSLKGNEKLALGKTPKNDLEQAMVHLRSMDTKQFKNMMGTNFPGVRHKNLIELIERVFLSV